MPAAQKRTITTFARKLLAEWRRLELPIADASVVVAVSGGADSTALLLAIAELIAINKLKFKPIVAHLDHGLRKDSRLDAQWVAKLAGTLNIDLDVAIARANLRSKRATSDLRALANLEQAARNARYEFLLQTANKKKAKLVVTAHTLDDQAETILMRFMRGSAAEGLASMAPVRALTAESDVKLLRPLVSWARRSETEAYCKSSQIDFRQDVMNDDEIFSRVRIRKQLLPLMKTFNPRIVEALNRTALLLGEDAQALSIAAAQLLKDATVTDKTATTLLDVHLLLRAPAAIRRRALREWILRAWGHLHRIEMVHLIAVERLLQGERGGRTAELPGGMKVIRRRGRLQLSDKVVEKDPVDL